MFYRKDQINHCWHEAWCLWTSNQKAKTLLKIPGWVRREIPVNHWCFMRIEELVLLFVSEDTEKHCCWSRKGLSHGWWNSNKYFWSETTGNSPVGHAHCGHLTTPTSISRIFYLIADTCDERLSKLYFPTFYRLNDNSNKHTGVLSELHTKRQ